MLSPPFLPPCNPVTLQPYHFAPLLQKNSGRYAAFMEKRLQANTLPVVMPLLNQRQKTVVKKPVTSNQDTVT